MSKNIFNNRRFKHGSLATAITIGFIVLVVIVNAIATILLERFPLTIDLTSEKRYGLSEETIQYVENLEKDVNITVCIEEQELKTLGILYLQAYEIIKSYPKYNNKISLDFVNVQKDPSFTQKYPGETVSAGDIIIETSLRKRKFSINDLFVFEQTQSGGQFYSSQAEQTITSALMYTADENPVTVSLITGQNNADVSGYTSFLEANNYTILQQDLLTEEINDACQMVILPQPSVDLTTDQVKKLETFLDNDGNFGKTLVFVAARDVAVGPILKNFLAEWGMEVSADYVFETNTAYAINNRFTVVNNIVNTDISSQLKNQQLPLILPESHPVNVLFEEKDNRETTVIAQTSDGAALYPHDAGEDFDPTSVATGVQNTIVKGSRKRYVGSTLVRSNVIAIGSQMMTDTSYMQYSGCNNGDLLVTLTNEATEKEDAVKILPVSFDVPTITISQSQVSLSYVVFVAIIPLLVIAVGVIIWLRRRHL